MVTPHKTYNRVGTLERRLQLHTNLAAPPTLRTTRRLHHPPLILKIFPSNYPPLILKINQINNPPPIRKVTPNNNLTILQNHPLMDKVLTVLLQSGHHRLMVVRNKLRTLHPMAESSIRIHMEADRPHNLFNIPDHLDLQATAREMVPHMDLNHLHHRSSKECRTRRSLVDFMVVAEALFRRVFRWLAILSTVNTGFRLNSMAPHPALRGGTAASSGGSLRGAWRNEGIVFFFHNWVHFV
jgi:hypothetical protein